MVTLELRFGKIILLEILLTKGATNRIVFDFVFDVAHKESGGTLWVVGLLGECGGEQSVYN